MNRILVIIVTYNGMEWVDRCISSVLHSQVKADVIVIDNGSSDGTLEHIRKKFPFVLLYESHENLGFGKANNIGLKYAVKNNYDYIYLLNQDAWINEQTLGYLIDVMKKHSDYGIISPVQSNANGGLDRNFAYCCPNGMLSDFFRNQLKELYEVNEVMAAHWLVSRKCLETVGGFSPAFPHYGEDNNYIQRANFHGYKVGIATGNIVVHDRSCRLLTKKQIIYRQYIEAITIYSNPQKKASIIKLLFWNFFKNSITLHSLQPFSYCFKFLSQLNKLGRIKRESLKKQIFLD